MYHQFIGRNGNCLYRKVLTTLSGQGDPVAPRGKATLEMQGITTVLEPLERILTVPGRANNPFFSVAENIAIIAALEDQKRWFEQFNKQYIKVAHDNLEDMASWAFYGTRLRSARQAYEYTSRGGVDQLKAITRKLTEDPLSRQAVATLWDPVYDNEIGHRDYPCNFAVEFKIRSLVLDRREQPPKTHDVLHMTVINRSNDIHWGLFGVNLNQWSFIQEVLAAILGVGVGHQIHVSDSLHLYLDEPHASITESMLRLSEEAAEFDVYDYTRPIPMFDIKQSWDDVDKALEQFFTDWYSPHETTYVAQYGWKFLNDAWSFLKAYHQRKNFDLAMVHINLVEDSALWVSGVEYLCRGRSKPATLMDEIKKRFPTNEGQKAITRYIAYANQVKTIV